MDEKTNTLIIIKPDGVKRGLVGKVLAFFEGKGYQLEDIKMVRPTREHITKHYAKFVEKEFFPRILNFMTSGNIVVATLKGYNCIENVRKLIGATDPSEAKPNTVRGMYANCIQENLIHASENKTEFVREWKIWFEELSC